MARQDKHKDFGKCLDSVAKEAGRDRRDVFNDFLVLAACTLANSLPPSREAYEEREAEYLSVAGKYDREQLELMGEALALLQYEFIKNPDQDILGPYISINRFTDASKGQFFTPYTVCKCAAMLTDPCATDRWVADECCGPGGMLIAAWNLAKARNADDVAVYGRDISRTCALACYLQLCMLGARGVVCVGDTLKNTVVETWLTPEYVFGNMLPDEARRLTAATAKFMSVLASR